MIKAARYIGLFGSIGLMLCPMLPVQLILLSGAMVLFGFSVNRMDQQRMEEEL